MYLLKSYYVVLAHCGDHLWETTWDKICWGLRFWRFQYVTSQFHCWGPEVMPSILEAERSSSPLQAECRQRQNRKEPKAKYSLPRPVPVTYFFRLDPTSKVLATSRTPPNREPIHSLKQSPCDQPPLKNWSINWRPRLNAGAFGDTSYSCHMTRHVQRHLVSSVY